MLANVKFMRGAAGAALLMGLVAGMIGGSAFSQTMDEKQLYQDQLRQCTDEAALRFLRDGDDPMTNRAYNDAFDRCSAIYAEKLNMLNEKQGKTEERRLDEVDAALPTDAPLSVKTELVIRFGKLLTEFPSPDPSQQSAVISCTCYYKIGTEQRSYQAACLRVDYSDCDGCCGKFADSTKENTVAQ